MKLTNFNGTKGAPPADSGTAYVTDGTNVVAFNAATLQPSWTYSTSGGTLSFVAATSGGGVAINDDQQGIIQLDSTGSPSAPVASLQGATPYKMETAVTSLLNISLGLWTRPIFGLNQLVGPAVDYAASVFLMPAGGPQIQRSAVSAFPASISYTLGPITQLSGQAIVVNGVTLEPNPAYGYMYLASGTVLDQNRQAIENQTMTLYEFLQTTDSNPKQNPNPPGGKTGVSRLGVFGDVVAFYNVGPPAPQPGQFWNIKQLLTVTTKTQSYNNIRINCTYKEYDHATVTDVTSTPNSACP